jgi:thiol-disulfide isomerase/thioredoxin
VNRRLLRACAFLAVAVIAGAAGFYLKRENVSPPVVESAAQALMSIPLTDLSGTRQALAQWRGKVLVVNLWATWCAPCRAEMPALMRVQRRFASNGVQLVGIALDSASKVREFAGETRIDYTLLIGGMDTLEVSRDLGNRAGVLPFTVVLNRAGNVAYTHAGPLTEDALAEVLSPLL